MITTLCKSIASVVLLIICVTAAAGPATVGSVEVKTRAPENRVVTVHYRVPANYDGNSKTAYRVLILFGGRNTTGQSEVNSLGWGEWADRYGVFVVSPGFKNDDYWQPQEWSGAALFGAIAEIGKKYKICQTKFLYYGYSAGSQCSNLFALWKPDLTRAWVSHACGVFFEPSPKYQGVPGLVTCGDADSSRYIISRKFVQKNRNLGVNILWRSFPNTPHDVPPDSIKLARTFLTYYHLRYLDDLKSMPTGRVPKESYPFIGDDSDGVYYPAGSPRAKTIAWEDQVPIQSQVIAEAWGKAAQ